MRIGLFTDTYRPSVNGIVYVVEILRSKLEAEGHEVFVFCNAEKTLRRSKEADDHIIRFPSIKQLFFDDYDLSLFFPPRELKHIKEKDLDIIMFFTPSQVGLMGVYAATKLGIPLVSQYSTDLYEYVEHYPMVIPGVAALGLTLPFAIKMDSKDTRDWLRSMLPRRRPSEWSRQNVESLITMVHQRCDGVVVLSQKSLRQMSSWQGHEECNFALIPTGVDALPSSRGGVRRFREAHGIKPSDRVCLYAGRLGVEKNLELLFPMMERVLKKVPQAKLVLVGDFEYRKRLEELAAQSTARDAIIFTGRYPREELGDAYCAADVFVFPSVKDTQGLVLHEAAHAGLPIVMCDGGVTEVVHNEENGLIVKNSPISFANGVSRLLLNPALRRSYGDRSRRIAKQFTEKQQTKKLLDFMYDLIAAREEE